MAKVKVIHSIDGCMIEFKGDKSNPEPSTGVIKFPGGHVEVSRTSDGRYWAHIQVDEPENTKQSRIDYNHQGYVETGGMIPDVPHADKIKHIAVLIDGPYKEEWERH